MATARLGILLSGSGTTYDNLARAVAARALDAEIVVVVSSRADAGGLALARAHGHPAVIAAAQDAVTAALREHRAQWVAMCGWLRFWDPPAEFAGKTVNIHPSLLPEFGGKGMYGLRVHQAVLAAKRERSGCTVHLVTGDYDSGPILGRSEVPVLPGDNAESLQARVQEAERALYPRALAALFARR